MCWWHLDYSHPPRWLLGPALGLRYLFLEPGENPLTAPQCNYLLKTTLLSGLEYIVQRFLFCELSHQTEVMNWGLFCKLKHGFAHWCWTFAYLLLSRTLEFLMRHLARLADYCSITNMHTKNLAIVWAPNLLRYLLSSLPPFKYKTDFFIYSKPIPVVQKITTSSSWEGSSCLPSNVFFSSREVSDGKLWRAGAFLDDNFPSPDQTRLMCPWPCRKVCSVASLISQCVSL